VPFAFVAYSTTPFVAFVHVRLPTFARTSRELLQRFAKNAPGNTRVDITTMNLIGKPRVAEAMLSDLYAVRQRFGTVNFARGRPPGAASREWYRWFVPPPSTKFYLQNPDPKHATREGWVWDELADSIARRSQSRVR